MQFTFRFIYYQPFWYLKIGVPDTLDVPHELFNVLVLKLVEVLAHS